MVQPRFFGMVSTSSSKRYTEEALRSFAATTRMRKGDRFFLIDNDATLSGAVPSIPGLTVVTNEAPAGFATNMNRVLRQARQARADLFFLNNDLIFTRGWLEPLEGSPLAILSPVSNAEVEYDSGKLSCRFTMDLEDYVGLARELDEIAAKHQKRARGYLSAFSFPFFCVKIPHAVHSLVGDLDERFGPGGGEDKDYCIRTLLAGFSVQHALGSYVLHFQGKSTWRGPEAPEDTAKRNNAYVQAFVAKWGEPLTRLFVYQDEKVVGEAGLGSVRQAGRLSEVVRLLWDGENREPRKVITEEPEGAPA